MRTVPEAILESLDEINRLANSQEVCDHIIANKYYDFSGKTPVSTISAQLGAFIRQGDSRVRRIKREGGIYYYYFAHFLLNNNKIYNKSKILFKIKWLFIGVLFIFILNILRVSIILYATNKKWHSLFNIDHHTVFNIVSYGFIFFLMYLYNKNSTKYNL